MRKLTSNFNIEQYWRDPPPLPSVGCVKWLAKIRAGWRPNRCVGSMDYYSASEFYRVYIWEYFNVIRPAIERGS